MPDESNGDLCRDCKQKSIKIIAPIATIGASAIMYFLLKNKTGGIPAEKISDVITGGVSVPNTNTNPALQNLTKDMLDKLIDISPRGIKAVVQGDSIKYIFSSASGKTTYNFWFDFDKMGNLIKAWGTNTGSNSPRFFLDNLMKLLEKIN